MPSIVTLRGSGALIKKIADKCSQKYQLHFLPKPPEYGDSKAPKSGWAKNFRASFGGSQNGDFQKGGFGGCSPVPKPERGYIRMFPGAKNENASTFAKTALLRNRAFVSSRLLASLTMCGDVVHCLNV